MIPTRDELIEKMGESLRKECLQIFGAAWSNDVARQLANAALQALLSSLPAAKEHSYMAIDDPIYAANYIKLMGMKK